MVVVALPDTMLGRGVAHEIAGRGATSLFAPEVLGTVHEADIVVLNLECCISAQGTRWEAAGKLFHFWAPPQVVHALEQLGVDS